ncbi:MAG: iron-containing alcohol dehydrogenase, partial [Burkholderiales bacterium]|nr:iron-containing alcohol dehydrogenase [Burkholderiales bacterium]
VIMRKSTHEKFSFMNRLVFPQFSILDPTKTYTLPKSQIANGIADAFVHTIEQYLTFPVQALPQDRFAEGLLQRLIEIAPQAMTMEPDYDNRANLMWVATLALNGLIGAGVPQDWATHMIGHEITALFGIDHARTLALVLPSLLNVQREQKRAKLLQYAERVWHINEGSEEQRIDMAILRTREFFESLGIKTRLSEYELGEEAIVAILAQLEAHGMTALGEHQDVTLARARVILQQAL